jgi:hypothetical protein
MIGLGGAEFRLPLLVGLFGFVALQAVILNKAMSLIVVATALPARLLGVPYRDVAAHWAGRRAAGSASTGRWRSSRLVMERVWQSRRPRPPGRGTGSAWPRRSFHDC